MSQKPNTKQPQATESRDTTALPPLKLHMHDNHKQSARPAEQETTFQYSPVELPPQAWQGRSPVLPQPSPSRRLRPGWEERVPDLTRRIEKLEQDTEAVLRACGRRALNNATLPGLAPVTNPDSSVSRQNDDKRESLPWSTSDSGERCRFFESPARKHRCERADALSGYRTRMGF